MYFLLSDLAKLLKFLNICGCRADGCGEGQKVRRGDYVMKLAYLKLISSWYRNIEVHYHHFFLFSSAYSSNFVITAHFTV